MNIYDSIYVATSSFLIGALSGVFSEANRRLEDIAFRETLVFSKDERELKTKIRKLKYTLPCYIGGTYAMVASATSITQQNALENGAVAIPAAYVGELVGSLIQKIVRPSPNIKIAKRMLHDPENILEYLPANERETLENCLAEIESLSGPDIIQKSDRIDDIDERLNAFHKKAHHKAYFPLVERHMDAVMKTILIKKAEIIRTGETIRQFFESDEIFSSAYLSQPSGHLKLVVYEIDEQQLTISRAELDNFTISRSDLQQQTEANVELVDLTITHKEPWNRDYERLAQRVLDDKKEREVIFLNTPSGTPDTLKRETVTHRFIDAYVEYLNRE